MSLRYFVLGLLAQHPMSGYDIKRLLKAFSWLIGNPSPGSLYPLLRNLLEGKLVTVQVIPGLDRPPRKIYSIQEAGRQELQSWLDRPAAADASLKAFVMRLLLAENLTSDRLIDHLQQRRMQVAGYRTVLDDMARAPDIQDDPARSLALAYGLALASAELAWLDGALIELSPAG